MPMEANGSKYLIVCKDLLSFMCYFANLNVANIQNKSETNAKSISNYTYFFIKASCNFFFS